MRTKIKNIKENSYRSVLFLTLAVVVFLAVVYIVATVKIKKAIIDSVNKIGNNYIEFNYEKIKVSVYPFFIKTTLSNINVDAGVSGGDSIRINISQIIARNILFSKEIDIKLPEKMKISINNEVNSEIIIGENYTNLVLGDKYTIKNVDFFSNFLELTNTINKNVKLKFENITFKIIKLMEADYTNTTTRFNIDKISTKITDKNIEIENNLEIILSNIKEFDSTRNVVNINNIIDTFNFSDITNNYAFNIHGSYSAGRLDRNISVDMEMEIVNYNYLISALNHKGEQYFLNKAKLSNLVQLLELVPANEKNTKSNRYYKIIGNSSSKVLLLNNEDFNNIVKKVFYKNNL